MRRVVLIRCEGVLVRESFTGPATGPGMAMLRWALADPQHEPIVLTYDYVAARRWLYEEALVDDHLKVWDDHADDPIRTARYYGYDVAMYVDNDPQHVKLALRAGVTSLLFASPAFQRPEFDPATRAGGRAWADIEAEMGRQMTQRDARTLQFERDVDDPFENA